MLASSWHSWQIPENGASMSAYEVPAVLAPVVTSVKISAVFSVGSAPVYGACPDPVGRLNAALSYVHRLIIDTFPSPCGSWQFMHCGLHAGHVRFGVYPAADIAAFECVVRLESSMFVCGPDTPVTWHPAPVYAQL
jgi:hypothetical protein